MAGRHLSVRPNEDTFTRLDAECRREGDNRSQLAKSLIEEGLRMRAVFTENTDDFIRLARQRFARSESHPGLILTTDHRLPRKKPRTLDRVIRALDALLSSGFEASDLEHWLG